MLKVLSKLKVGNGRILKVQISQMVFKALKLVFEMIIIQAFTEVLVRAPILGTTPCWKKKYLF
jgi:hypothetical protein